jgi:hypothetical protein
MVIGVEVAKSTDDKDSYVCQIESIENGGSEQNKNGLRVTKTYKTTVFVHGNLDQLEVMANKILSQCRDAKEFNTQQVQSRTGKSEKVEE